MAEVLEEVRAGRFAELRQEEATGYPRLEKAAAKIANPLEETYRRLGDAND
jgi:hypothetical protein